MIVITMYIKFCTLSMFYNTDDFDPLNPVLIVRKREYFFTCKIINCKRSFKKFKDWEKYICT